MSRPAPGVSRGLALCRAVRRNTLAAAFILAITILRQPKNSTPPQAAGTADEEAVHAMSSIAA